MNHIDATALRQMKSLSPFSMSQLQKLAPHLIVRQFKKNQIIFDQDEEAKLVYLLISGVVRCSYLNSEETETIVGLLPTGEFFGLDALVPKTCYPFRCDAFDASVVGAIRPENFIEALLGVPFESFLPWYMATMDSGRRMYIHCIRGVGLDLRRRLALELLNLAESFGIADESGVVIVLRISHEVLAGLVGASRQQVTEHLNEFDRKNIISREGRRIVINRKKLRTIVEMEPSP